MTSVNVQHHADVAALPWAAAFAMYDGPAAVVLDVDQLVQGMTRPPAGAPSLAESIGRMVAAEERHYEQNDGWIR